MKIYLASDHAGFELKEILRVYVEELGYETEDCGALAYDAGDDYPEYIRQAAQKVSNNSQESKAIILGGSGQGEAMVANRYPNVRATVYYGGSEEIITLSREHNDANVLSLGARFLSTEDAKHVVKTWLSTAFSNEERHVRRINSF